MAVGEYEAGYSALDVCLAAGVPVILWGPPGQGKTSVIRDLAAQQGRHLEVILASIREPQDFAGLPVVAEGSMRLAAPDWATRLASHDAGILFLDEVNTAPPSVQAALLRVSLDRVAGDCYLGDGTSVVAAANPPEIAADGWDLAPPLANRFCHLPWSLPVDVVREGFAGRWPSYPVVVPDADEVQAAARVEQLRLGAFLTARPELLTVVPKTSAEQGRSFPTPRSWEMVATLLGWSSGAGLPAEVDRVLAQGCVGRGASAEYLTFRDNLDLADPEQVLVDPRGVAMPARADRIFVLAGSTVLAATRVVTASRWLAAGTLLERVADAGHPDIAVTFARPWIRARPPDQELPAGVLRSLVPLLVEAGLL